MGTDDWQTILDGLVERRSELSVCVDNLRKAADAVCKSLENDGTLFTCGNGGSYADAVHIVGELVKRFERPRPLPAAVAKKLKIFPHGDELAERLEAGLRAITLGLNASLKTAVENDNPLRNAAFAQEAAALMRKGDVLLALSTSGNAKNCLMAMSAAKAVGGKTVVLTGADGGEMGQHGDIVIKAPGKDTKTIQEAHMPVYHTLCQLVEAYFFEKGT